MAKKEPMLDWYYEPEDLPPVKNQVLEYELTREPIPHPYFQNGKRLSLISLMLNHAINNYYDFLGGKRPQKSRIKHDPDERTASYWENAVTAMCCELVLNILYAGKEQGMANFYQSRRMHEINPRAGDKGKDVPNKAIDMKGTFLRHPKRQGDNGAPLSVRGGYPKLGHDGERYEGHTYVHGLIPKDGLVSKCSIDFGFDEVHLGSAIQSVIVRVTGWCKDSDLQQWPWILPTGSRISPLYDESNCINPWDLRPMIEFPFKEAKFLKAMKEIS